MGNTTLLLYDCSGLLVFNIKGVFGFGGLGEHLHNRKGTLSE